MTQYQVLAWVGGKLRLVKTMNNNLPGARAMADRLLVPAWVMIGKSRRVKHRNKIKLEIG